ncbi:MAG: hypothetical protein CMK59_08565 [Proteobacteria bacterium]|nr:hypothetical protein [Pseudomonadota bacterium]
MIFLFSLLWAAQGWVAHQGEPVVNARVYAIDQRLTLYEARTDTQGQFIIEDLPNLPVRLLTLPPSNLNAESLYYPNTSDLCSGEVFEKLDTLSIILPSADRIYGVLEQNNLPIAQALVVAYPREEHLFPRGAYTNDQGQYLLEGLSKEASGWTIEVGGEYIPTQWLGGGYDDTQAEYFEIGSDLHHQLLAGISVSGTVQSQDNELLNEADVHVYSGGEVKSTQTVDGRYIVHGLPPGEVLSWASLEGYATTYYPTHSMPTDSISAPEEDTLVENSNIILPYESAFEIELWENDLPVDGASVLLYNEAHTVGRGIPVEDGYGIIDALHPGTYELMIFAANDGYSDGWYANGGLATTPELLELEENDLKLISVDLPMSGSISLNIIDEHNVPVYGADALLYASDGTLYRSATNINGEAKFWGLKGDEYELELHYTAFCTADPGYCSSYGGAINPDEQKHITLEDLENIQLNFVLLQDNDHDNMGDAWEQGYGLDTNTDDSSLDLDEDGLTNLEEFYLQSNPQSPPGCSCNKSDQSLLLSLPLCALWIRRQRWLGS